MGLAQISGDAFIQMDTTDSTGSSQSLADLFLRVNGSAMYLYLGAGGSDDRWKLTASENIANNDVDPALTNTRSLGSSSKRWYKGWFNNAIDESSDAALKENMVTLTDGLDIIDMLNPIKYNKIGETTTRFGFTSQAVKEVMIDKGYGEDVSVYSEMYDENTGGTAWGLAPTQLIAHLVASVKELKERIIVLEGG